MRDEGHLEVVVNNAFRVPEHMDPKVPFWDTPLSDWDTMIDVGTRSAYVAAHHAAKSRTATSWAVCVVVIIFTRRSRRV